MTITYTDGGRISELVLAGRRGRVETLGSDVAFDINAIAFSGADPAKQVNPSDAALQNTDNHRTVPDWVTDLCMLYWIESNAATGTFTTIALGNDAGICSPQSSFSIPKIVIGANGPNTATERVIPVWAIGSADNLDGASNSAGFDRPYLLLVGPHASTSLIGNNPGTTWTTGNGGDSTLVDWLDGSNTAVEDHLIAPIPSTVCPYFRMVLSGTTEANFRANNPNVLFKFRFIGMHME